MPSEPNSTGGLWASIRTRQKAFRGISLGPSSDNGAECAAGRLQPGGELNCLKRAIGTARVMWSWPIATSQKLRPSLSGSAQSHSNSPSSTKIPGGLVAAVSVRAVLSGHRRDRARDRLFPQ